MDPLTKDDFVSLFFFLVVWYGFKPYGRDTSGARAKRIASNLDEKALSDSTIRFYTALGRQPSPLFFGYAWLVVYAAVIAANFIYWRQATTDDDYTTVLVLFLFNLFFNKLWAPIFFQDRLVVVALVDLLAALGTAIAIAILLGDELGRDTLAFVGIVIYTVWLGVALLLHVYFLIVYAGVDVAAERAKLHSKPGVADEIAADNDDYDEDGDALTQSSSSRGSLTARRRAAYVYDDSDFQ